MEDSEGRLVLGAKHIISSARFLAWNHAGQVVPNSWIPAWQAGDKDITVA